MKTKLYISMSVTILIIITMVCSVPELVAMYAIGNCGLHYPYEPMECERLMKCNVNEKGFSFHK